MRPGRSSFATARLTRTRKPEPMSFLRLFNQFVLRAVWREKMRSLVVVLGVALGVAVMVAIRLANQSVTDSFRGAVDAVGGNASLRVRGAAGRLNELLLTELDWLRDFGQISPVIEAYAMFGDSESRQLAGDRFPRGELLHVLGVDVLLDFPLRDYQLLKVGGEASTQPARDALRLLDDPRGVILTEKFLRRHQLRVGDQVPLTFDSEQRDFTIRGVLLNRGPARTLDGNFALMDIAAAQVATGRLGLLDYLDVMLPDGESADAAGAAIQRRLPDELVAERPDAASGRADTMIAAFQFNLTALSAVALIVGMFLIYNTVAISVAARREEIGMLQAVGAGRRVVLWLFLVEALLLAGVGLALGLPLGRLLAPGAVSATAQTVETFYIAAIAESSASSLRISIGSILAVGLLVVPLAIVAALVPAREAASVPPVEAMRGQGVRLGWSRVLRLAGIGLLCLGAGWGLTFGPPLGGQPMLGFLAEMMIMIGGALFTPLLLGFLCWSTREVCRRFHLQQTVFRLAASNLQAALSRVSVSVAALGISLAMMIAVAIMVGSFRETVVVWLDAALSADLSLKPVMQTSSVSEARLSANACRTVRDDPMSRIRCGSASRQIPYGVRNIRLAVTDIDKMVDYGRLIFKDRLRLPRHAGQPSAVVSESFSILFDSGCGDSFTLPTPQGPMTFQVAGVYYDYASNQGTVTLDRADFETFFGENDPQLTPQHLSAYLRPNADPETVRKRIVDKLGRDEQVYCVTSAEVRTEALKIFESTFTITYALECIAIVVAGLGVASTLITLIYQRQRDMGLLSLIGATYRQVRRVIVWEAMMLAAASQLLGILVGLLLALVLIYVINVQSFGWTIQFHLPWQFMVQSTILVVVASALFGLYPAIRAAGVDALQTVREQHA